MSQRYVLPLNDPQATLATVGGKGASLARLANAALPVPGGFHVTTEAYRVFVEANDLQPAILAALEDINSTDPASLEAASTRIRDLFAEARIPADIAAAIRSAYAELPNPQSLIPDTHPPVAVRSSATAEDLPEASFAGQQETFLNVNGADAVLEATVKCWASLWTARAIAYRARQGIPPESVALAVVVQLLVPAVAAGILFTADPVTGRRDQVVISAAWGLGEAIVGGLVTPDSLTVDKATGRVLKRQTADKRVMTVRADGGTHEQPVPEHLRRAPVLDDAAAAELAQLAVQIENLYGVPMDIEWAVASSPSAPFPRTEGGDALPSPERRGAGGGVFILQARPITALPAAPELLPPTRWQLPRGAYAAMRNNIIELMAEPLTPLFGSLGRTAINTSFNRLLTNFFGRPGILPPEPIIMVNEYAYYNGSLKPGALLRLLAGSVGIMKRMYTGAVERWTETGRPHYLATVARWQAESWRELPATGLLDAARELTEAAIDAYGALVSGAIPAAWISEALFTAAYNRLIRRRDDPPAPTFLLGFDSTPIRAEKSLYDLASWARTSAGLTACLSNTPAQHLAAQRSGDQPPPGVNADDWREWRRRLAAHLQQYGHTIYDLDFANPTPADDPAPVLETLKLFVSGQGTDPHARQQAAAERRTQATQAMEERLTGLRLRLFRKLLASAQRYAPLREDGLADIGLAYPMLRQMLLELGRRFVAGGLIDKPEEIFWLSQEEAAQAAARLDRREPLARLTGLIPQRQAVWRAAGRATPPTSLPRIALPGRKQADRPQRSGVTIKGVAASPGFVTAPACVMHGPGDFSRMQTGRVLVAPITTPAWTPLFARAAAIVTDVGGPLSHGSIVAREYGIPAVLGTGCATQRIADGQTITVDGTEGKVTLVARPEPGVSSAIEWKRPNPKGQYMRGSVVDLLPDPVSPLFATLAIPAVARVGVKDVLRPLTRSEPDLPADYIVTINDYLYMGVAFTPHQWWWIVTRMMASFPRMLREALPLWRDKIRPHYAATIAAWEDKPLGAMSAAELWAAIQEVDDAAMLHLASLLVATTGASAGSEMLFTRVYGKLIRREGDPAAPTFLMGYDSTPIRAEKSLYDVAMWCQGQADLSAHLRETPAEQLVAQLANGQTPVSGWQEFRDRLQAHLNDYGHIIYTLDFGRPLPLDDATPMLGTIKMYLAGQGINPYERQAAAEAKRIQAAEATLARLRGLRRWAFRKTLGMAQTMAAVREDALSDVGLGYPLLRAMLRELGRRLTEAGGIEDSDDIFWLEAEQVSHVVAALGSGGPAANLASDVAQRKSRHEMLKRVIPPPTLPPRKRYLGINMAEFTPAAAESQTGASLRGIGASAGRVTAPACVLAGPEDFDRMRPGDVLVAATTTPAWTPLFAMASAVITDIGGPLSHGSIVAREYGIPAVMGTGVATKRIPSGQVVTVDGGAGRVDW